MQTLGLDDEKPIEVQKSFWTRQFQEQPTNSQTTFDLIYGVLLPIACFLFDPLVFKGDWWGAAMLGTYKPFAYILSFTSIMSMLAWLIWRDRLKGVAAPLAGLFAVSGIVSLIIGIIIAPLSLLGLIVLIGALGLTPLFSSIVYLRNAVRAYHAAKPFTDQTVRIYSVGLAALFAVVIPYVVNVELENAMGDIKHGNDSAFRSGTWKLRMAAPLVNFDYLALYYHRLPDEKQMTPEAAKIAEFYEEMTGREMEESAWVLMD